MQMGQGGARPRWRGRMQPAIVRQLYFKPSVKLCGRSPEGSSGDTISHLGPIGDTKMRAAVCPALKGKWEVREVPNPEAGPGQVLIRVHASGLCYTDVHETHGDMPMGLTPPCIFGHEGAGEVVAVGPGVTARKAGDRVGVVYFQGSCGRCEWCLRDKGFFCRDFVGTGAHTPGSHAEYMVALANTTMVIPDGVSYEQAAPIFCAGYTVWSGSGSPRPNRTRPSPWSESAAWAIWQSSTPRPRASRLSL
jgi:hypothetical protein